MLLWLGVLGLAAAGTGAEESMAGRRAWRSGDEGRALVVAFAAAVIALAASASCAAGGGRREGAGGAGAAAGQGGAMSFDGGTGAGDANPLDPDAACASARDEATWVPVNMYIMFDKSNSMLDQGKWAASTAALQSFFSEQASAGLRVALRFFPDSGCDGSCTVQACATPMVPLGELTVEYAPTDQQENALINAFGQVIPSGATPMSAALQGATSWAVHYLQSHPTEKAVVVLVTDGEPTDCNTKSSYIVGLAADAYSAHGVLTFAVGLEGSSEALMNDIAKAGGTSKGIFVGSPDAEQELLAAMNAIRESSVACEFLMPDPGPGKQIEPDLVNVIYKSGPDGPPQIIGQVPSAGGCGPAGGWYYDDPVKPTRIIFCEGTCAAVRADPNAKIEILLGCATIPA
ncbi:MAG: VWA domain-containing protein [Deltaproteobacteria bacterium]|nr:VWA domain-containing protein [Deltaproteobacteria bacterium]